MYEYILIIYVNFYEYWKVEVYNTILFIFSVNFMTTDAPNPFSTLSPFFPV